MFRRLFGAARGSTAGSSTSGAHDSRSSGTQATLDAVERLKEVRNCARIKPARSARVRRARAASTRARGVK